MTPAAELLAAMPDPVTVAEHWRRLCREMVSRTAAAEYERGFADGHLATIADLKKFQHAEVRGAELELRRWHVCCRECRASRCRPRCPDCQDRTRSAFAGAMPGDYPGRRAAAA